MFTFTNTGVLRKLVVYIVYKHYIINPFTAGICDIIKILSFRIYSPRK